MAPPPYEPYYRYEEYEDQILDVSNSLNAQIAQYHRCDLSLPASATLGSGTLSTSSGSPTLTADADACFFDSAGNPIGYYKLDSGDVLTCSAGGSNLEQHFGGWFRFDSFPGADANVIDGLGSDMIGIDPSGQVFVANAGTKQGTYGTPLTLGQWYMLTKMNDAGGAGTGTWFYVDGVRVLSLAGSGGVKNPPGLVGGTGFDGACAGVYWGRGTTALTDTLLANLYFRAVRKEHRGVSAL